jgi:DNA-binding IclR family transcriptional regulator
VFVASLADREADQLIRAVGLRRNTERSITDPYQYMEEIRKARMSGYALDDGEYLQGVRAVAAPIHAPGPQISAIWVVGFSQSMKDAWMTVIAAETKDAAQAISRKLDLRRPGKEQ